MHLQLRITTKSIALIAIFAALYAVLGTVPMFYIFGTYGQFITAALVVAPIIGIVLGPAGGVLAVTIGGLAGMAVTGNTPMGIFSFLPGALDALCTGLAFRGKWYLSAAIFAPFILAFVSLPSIGDAKYFVWFIVVGFFLLLSPATTLAARFVRTFNVEKLDLLPFKTVNVEKLVLGVAIFALIGVLVDEIVGSFIFQVVAPLPPSEWEAVAFVYPVERLLATIMASIVGAAIIRGVRPLGIEIGEAIA